MVLGWVRALCSHTALTSAPQKTPRYLRSDTPYLSAPSPFHFYTPVLITDVIAVVFFFFQSRKLFFTSPISCFLVYALCGMLLSLRPPTSKALNNPCLHNLIQDHCTHLSLGLLPVAASSCLQAVLSMAHPFSASALLDCTPHFSRQTHFSQQVLYYPP